MAAPAAGVLFAPAVEVICAANWVCMATKVAGSVVGVTVPVAVGIAITAKNRQLAPVPAVLVQAPTY